MSEPLDSLRTQLGAHPPAAVAALGDDQLAHLSDALRGARRRQAAELSRAGEQAFEHIPRLLRGPVKKIVGQ